MIKSDRIYKDKTGKEKTTLAKRYYISSHVVDARYFNESVREHWSIENKLHWRLDFQHEEDQASIRNENAAINLSTIHKWVIGTFNQVKTEKEALISIHRKAMTPPGNISSKY